MNQVMRAIEHLEPQTQARLAEVCDQRPQEVYRWVKRGRPPAQYCIVIEQATGGAVTRYDLRPDVFGPPPARKTRAA